MRTGPNGAVDWTGGREQSAGRRRRGGSDRSDPALVTDGGSDRPADDADPTARNRREGDERADEEADAGDGGDGAAGDGDVSAEAMLLSANVLEEVPGGYDLRLTDEFADAWRARIEQMRDGNRALRWFAAGEDLNPADLTVDDDGGFVVTHDGDQVGAWHSEATFLADVVAEPTLREHVPESAFERLPAAHRDELSASLLMFLERCPSCDGDLALSETDGDDGQVHVSLDCTACGSTVAAGTHQ